MEHEACALERRAFQKIAVNRVSHYWAAKAFHVHADLVGSACLDSDSHERERPVGCEAFVNSDGSFPLARSDGSLEPFSVLRVSHNLRLDFPLEDFRTTAADCDVFLCDSVVMQEFFVQEFFRRPVFRRNDYARCVFVKPVYDSWPSFCERFSVHSFSALLMNRPAPPVIQERVHERPRPISCRGMRDHSLLFVHDTDILILIDDFKRDVFRLYVFGDVFFPLDVDDVAGPYLRGKFRRFSVHQNFSRRAFEPGAVHARSAEFFFWKRGDEFIETGWFFEVLRHFRAEKRHSSLHFF